MCNWEQYNVRMIWGNWITKPTEVVDTAEVEIWHHSLIHVLNFLEQLIMCLSSVYGLHRNVFKSASSRLGLRRWWAPVEYDDPPRDARLDSWWTGWSHARATWGRNPEQTVPPDGLTMGLRFLTAPRIPPAYTWAFVQPSRDEKSLIHRQTSHAIKGWRQQSILHNVSHVIWTYQSQLKPWCPLVNAHWAARPGSEHRPHSLSSGPHATLMESVSERWGSHRFFCPPTAPPPLPFYPPVLWYLLPALGTAGGRMHHPGGAAPVVKSVGVGVLSVK